MKGRQEKGAGSRRNTDCSATRRSRKQNPESFQHADRDHVVRATAEKFSEMRLETGSTTSKCSLFRFENLTWRAIVIPIADRDKEKGKTDAEH